MRTVHHPAGTVQIGGTEMVFRRAHFTGAPVAECPQCNTVCVYWDSDDLDDDGKLICHCDTATE